MREASYCLKPKVLYDNSHMPAPSKAMAIASAIALHNPSQLYPRNKSLLHMTDSQLRDYASTPRKGLIKKVKQPKVSISSLMKRKSAVSKPEVSLA